MKLMIWCDEDKRNQNEGGENRAERRIHNTHPAGQTVGGYVWGVTQPTGGWGLFYSFDDLRYPKSVKPHAAFASGGRFTRTVQYEIVFVIQIVVSECEVGIGIRHHTNMWHLAMTEFIPQIFGDCFCRTAIDPLTFIPPVMVVVTTGSSKRES